MAHSYSSSFHHCIFSTKERRNAIWPDLHDRLWPYLGGIAREKGMTLLAAGGTANHAHVLLRVPPALSLAKAMQYLKGGSSSWIHESFPSQRWFGWQDGYGEFSVSHSRVPEVIQYIQNQQEHHRKQTFEEEFLAFLQRHNIPYDPKYVFG